MSTSTTYTFYFGGELFSAKHLYGNAALAEAIFVLSGGRYTALLPQHLEQREMTAQSIRDTDLRALLGCDLGLFHYDGPELDSGTVVEYMVAKFADLPSVLLRTDFRSAGDGKELGGDAWNLMSSFYPRTRVLELNSLGIYQLALGYAVAQADVPAERRGSEAGRMMTEEIARDVIGAFDEVLALPPALPAPLTESVYRWLALMPGLAGAPDENTQAMLELCARKRAKGLL
ncbi:MAG TPA: nucleoside 2-deoxyribosyltransferase [Chthoniobacteraceae bacterium]|jgi:hypothetical protein|nr:nucleoside 2-deoxyribosyltransferase [Chthoniobacteraceae bacterium]